MLFNGIRAFLKLGCCYGEETTAEVILLTSIYGEIMFVNSRASLCFNVCNQCKKSHIILFNLFKY